MQIPELCPKDTELESPGEWTENQILKKYPGYSSIQAHLFLESVVCVCVCVCVCVYVCVFVLVAHSRPTLWPYEL